MTAIVPQSPLALSPRERSGGTWGDPRPSFLDLLRQGRVTLRPLTPDGRLTPRLRSSMLALDRAIRSQRETTPDGFLIIHRSVLTRAGCSPYRGDEIPDFQSFGLDPSKTYTLLRDPRELAKALASYNHLPILIFHREVSAGDLPPELVVGACGSEAVFDGDALTNSLILWSKPAIRAVETGERAGLSVGYHYRLDFTPGMWKSQSYDGIMRDLIAQHLALIETGTGRVNGAAVGDAMPPSLRRRQGR